MLLRVLCNVIKQFAFKVTTNIIQKYIYMSDKITTLSGVVWKNAMTIDESKKKRITLKIPKLQFIYHYKCRKRK